MLKGTTFLSRTIITSQDLGGRTLTPGFYIFPSVVYLDGVLTLDAQGDPDAVFVLRTESTLITSTNSSVVLINGGNKANIFWQVGRAAYFGMNTLFIGNVLTYANIS